MDKVFVLGFSKSQEILEECICLSTQNAKYVGGEPELFCVTHCIVCDVISAVQLSSVNAVYFEFTTSHVHEMLACHTQASRGRVQSISRASVSVNAASKLLP